MVSATTRVQAEHRWLKSGPLPIRGLGIHKNIPAYVTKQKPHPWKTEAEASSLNIHGLQVGFISSLLIADKHYPGNPWAITSPPKMSLLLEAKSTPALIIKPINVYPCCTHGWPELVHNVQPTGRFIFQNQVQSKIVDNNLLQLLENYYYNYLLVTWWHSLWHEVFPGCLSHYLALWHEVFTDCCTLSHPVAWSFLWPLPSPRPFWPSVTSGPQPSVRLGPPDQRASRGHQRDLLSKNSVINIYHLSMFQQYRQCLYRYKHVSAI